MFLSLTTPAITGSMLTFNDDLYHCNAKVAWVRRLGHAMIRQFKINIGGTDIDKHVGQWLDIWYELTHTVEQERGYSKMIGDVPELTTPSSPETSDPSEVVIPAYKLFIPLQFWFNRNPGLALPLIALQYHDVRVYVDMEDVSKLLVWSGAVAPQIASLNSSLLTCSLMVDYVYLDSEERRRFAQVGHEYLIEQLQFPGVDSLTASMSAVITQKTKLNFNHPCKELIWALTCGAYNGASSSYSASNQRNRFLAYTNVDGQWDSSALDYAAANLIYNSLAGRITNLTADEHAAAVADAAGNAATPINVVAPTGGIAEGLSSFNASLGVIPVNFTFVVDNQTGGVVTAGAQVATFFRSSFLQGSYNLLDSLACVSPTTPNALATVPITIVDLGTQQAPNKTSYIGENVVVTGHNLQLNDISIPVKDAVDYRVNRNPSGPTAVNPWDFSVIQPGNYGLNLAGRGNPVYQGNLQLNGQDRFDIIDGSYFNYVQPWECHTRTPADGVNVYSFGLHPEQHQPSGTCNMSRIDTAILNMWYSDPFRANQNVPTLNFVQDSRLFVFATNYNILRIMSGMGGLAYSN